MVVRVAIIGDKTTTMHLFRPYVDDGVWFENDHTAQGQLHNWNNATPHELNGVIRFRSFDGFLSDDPRPFSHITHIGLVHEPFNAGRIQCDLSVDVSGVVVGSFGPLGQSASDLFAMSVYQGSCWSIGGPIAPDGGSHASYRPYDRAAPQGGCIGWRIRHWHHVPRVHNRAIRTSGTLRLGIGHGAI